MSFERALIFLLFSRSYVPFDAMITLFRTNSPASDRGQSSSRDSFETTLASPMPRKEEFLLNKIVSSADRRRAVSRSSAFVRHAFVRYSACALHPPTLTKLAGAFRRPAAVRMPARRARAGHQTGARVARSLTKPRSCEAWSRDVSVHARGGGRAGGMGRGRRHPAAQDCSEAIERGERSWAERTRLRTAHAPYHAAAPPPRLPARGAGIHLLHERGDLRGVRPPPPCRPAGQRADPSRGSLARAGLGGELVREGGRDVSS